MAERLVDVLNSDKTVVHTFPITVGGPDKASKDGEYEEKALNAAGHAHLVADADLKGLSTRMHVARRGPLAPYGDDRHVLSQTKQQLDQVVRERAYFLWQQECCPEGRADEHWHRAHDQHLRERAYFLWEREGRPEERADEHWHGTREFEAY